MKKTIFLFTGLHTAIIFFFSMETVAQQRWTSNPFAVKDFVENKGQFNGKNGKINSEILFGASCEGIGVFFSSTGVTYLYEEYTMLSKEERIRQGKKKEEAVSIKPESRYLHIVWEGADPQAKIMAEQAVFHYYTYPAPDDNSGTKTLKAAAYKKITYKNLYPNVDVEYTFPENDKAGVKYSIILHPGADVSKIKMKYEGAQSLIKDAAGNVIIKSSFGDFIDHAPQTFYSTPSVSPQGGETNMESAIIPSYFTIKDQTVSFLIPTYKSSSSPLGRKGGVVIIDPWVTNPAYPGFNAAYDVEYDLAGNAYAYGGNSPFREVKINSAGVVQWVFTTAFTVAGYYGDLGVDGVSGSSYIIEPYAAFGNGTRIVKVSAAGAQVAMFPGDSRMQEMWRIMFDNCTRKPVIGGSSFTNPNNYQACLLDTNMTSITPVNVFGLTGSTSTPYNQDIATLTLDYSGNCFMSCCGNMFAKCAAATLAPTAYVLPNNHSFTELMSVGFVSNITPKTCGMNGMAASNKYVYTYDGGLIKRWNKNTGAYVNGAMLAPKSFRCGGIAVDECDNIFVGLNAAVVQYDTNFTVINTFPSLAGTDTVYDVRLAPGNILYACGRAFVSSAQMTLQSCASTMSITVSATGSCTGQGSATASVSGGAGPYSYIWNPSGQTTATATGLLAGTYTVTVSDGNVCAPKIQTATVTVNSSGSNMTVTFSQSNLLCNGVATGTASVTPSSGTLPYTYSWSPSGGSTSAATGLAAGTYTALVTDATGCIIPQVITITQPTAIVITASTTSTTCTSNSGTATANVSGGTAGYTYVWSNGQSGTTISGLAAGSYSVLVTDANGCTQTQSATVSSGGGLIVSATSTQTGCSANNGTATANPSSGTTPYTYVWSNGQTTQTATGLAAGNYSVTVSDAAGCIQTQVVAVTAATGPTATALASSATVTVGGSSSLSATGGVTYQWVPSTGLSCISCASPTASPLQTTIYCVIVTDANGCSDSACVTVQVDIPCGAIYIPNAFSPNNDQENDLECVMGACIETIHLTIYNRWGEIVFESRDQKNCWDGTNKSKPLNSAVFSYYLEATLKDGSTVIKKGNISLIR